MLMTEELQNSLFFSLNNLTRQINQLAEEEFSTTGLTPSYAILLMIVKKNPGIQPGKLSQLMKLTPSTITRIVEKLEYKGLVERKVEGRTGHLYVVKLSNQLEMKINRAMSSLEKKYQKLLGKRITQDMTKLIFNALNKLEE